MCYIKKGVGGQLCMTHILDPICALALSSCREGSKSSTNLYDPHPDKAGYQCLSFHRCAEPCTHVLQQTDLIKYFKNENVTHYTQTFPGCCKGNIYLLHISDDVWCFLLRASVITRSTQTDVLVSREVRESCVNPFKPNRIQWGKENMSVYTGSGDERTHELEHAGRVSEDC